MKSESVAIENSTRGSAANPDIAAPSTPGELSRSRRVLRAVANLFERIVGGTTIVVGLVVCLSVPVLQFLAFGYLLRSAGEIARSGRITRAFPGWRTAARIGSFGLVAWLFFLPARLLWGLAMDAELIEPGAGRAANLRVCAWVLGIAAGWHVFAAALHGLHWTRLFRPIANLVACRRGAFQRDWYGERYRTAVSGWNSLHLGELLSLGVRGYLGTALWLVVPSFFLLAGVNEPAMGVVGVGILTWVASHLPMAQVRFAAEDRIRAFFEVAKLRDLRARAPVVLFLASLLWLTLAISYGVFLIEDFPYGLLWIPSLAFVIAALPSRWLMGWAASCAFARDRSAGPWFRWPFWWLSFVASLAFAVSVYFMPYASFRGAWFLWDHPAFLLPILR